MRRILVVLSLIVPIALSFAQTKDESRVYFENSDRQLNDIYQRLVDAKKEDKLYIENLKISQQAWLKLRDAQLTLMYPDHSSIEKPDLLSSSELKYLAYLTDERVDVLLDLYNASTIKTIYVSDLQIICTEDINNGIGLDKPYWADEIVICGKRYRKGVVIHPKDGGRVAYAEFIIPKKGGKLIGVAGYGEGGSYVSTHGKMRFRIFVDDELIYGNELFGKECRGINLNLDDGKILRIETDDGGDRNYSDHMAFGDLKIVY